jgi:hypothetical protein
MNGYSLGMSSVYSAMLKKSRSQKNSLNTNATSSCLYKILIIANIFPMPIKGTVSFDYFLLLSKRTILLIKTVAYRKEKLTLARSHLANCVRLFVFFENSNN